MQVTFITGKLPLAGTLRYARDEHSFDFEPADETDLQRRQGPAGSTAIEIGTLQVEVGVATEAILYVWGYNPQKAWLRGPVQPPSTVPGEIRLASNTTLAPGVALAIESEGAWEALYDGDTGWLRFAPDVEQDSVIILIAEGVAVGLMGRTLHSLWLRPKME